jgi:hypothetical protein
MLTLQLEMMKRWAANDGEASAGQIKDYQTVVNTLVRTLSSLGLQRRQRDVTPSVADYVKHLNEQDEAEAEA